MQVIGELHDHLSSWDALRAALPVGTVSGAPKVQYFLSFTCFMQMLFFQTKTECFLVCLDSGVTVQPPLNRHKLHSPLDFLQVIAVLPTYFFPP